MRWLVLVGAAVLAACGGNELSPEEQAAQDARDIAAVEAASEIPAETIVPQKILYPDIEANNLYGVSCAFAPEGGGLGAIALAMEDAGYLKLDDEIVRLAADKGSTELPMATRSKYDGKAYSFELTLDDAKGEQDGIETVNYPAQLTIRDRGGNVGFASAGIAQCGS